MSASLNDYAPYFFSIGIANPNHQIREKGREVLVREKQEPLFREKLLRTIVPYFTLPKGTLAHVSERASTSSCFGSLFASFIAGSKRPHPL